MAETSALKDDLSATTPREAVGDGVVYITEDRKAEGFFETMSVPENIYIGQISSQQSR